MEYALTDALFDFEDEGIGAGELIALNRGAEKFYLLLGDATCNKLTVAPLPLL